jgi:hypothetical protein
MKCVLVGLLAAVAVAPAAAASPKTGFAFGRTGGSIRPFSLAISTTGRVTATGAAPAHRARLTQQQLADLNRTAFVSQFNTLAAVTACPHTLPDVAAEWIRVGGRTVRVHGSCLTRFNKLWAALNHAAVR